MAAASRSEIAHSVLSLFEAEGIGCTVLHGMEGGTVGRDVDVWIGRRDWPRTSAAVMALGRERSWNPVRTLGPFGLRFLFFTDPSVCGTLELHCVRDLDWFYVKKPDDILSLHPYKRFFMTLATGQTHKVRRELDREPLSDGEKQRLGDFMVRRGIFRHSELASFWSDVGGGDLDSAARRLRRAVLSRAKCHPVGVFRFCLKRLVKAVWMFAKPAGVCLFCASDATDARELATSIESRKGVFVEIVHRDFRRFGLVRSLFAFVRLRHAQGLQTASVVAICPRQRLLARLAFRPSFYETGDDPVLQIVETLRDVLVSRSSQLCLSREWDSK